MCKIDLLNNQSIIGFVYQGATKVAEYQYDAWGNCAITLDTDGIGTANPFRYRGYYWDNDLNLYYVQGRFYDPQIGRFISAADTSTLNPNSINGLNLYLFAHNNPINVSYNSSSSLSINNMSPIAGLQGTIYNNTVDYTLLTEEFWPNAFGIASDIFGMLNGLDVSLYLIQNPNDTTPLDELLRNYSAYGKISSSLGVASAIFDGLMVRWETNDWVQGIATGLYDWGVMRLSEWLGRRIGTAIGGVPGAIIGTLAGIAIGAILQYFKEIAVSWADDAWDAVFVASIKI